MIRGSVIGGSVISGSVIRGSVGTVETVFAVRDGLPPTSSFY